MWPFRKRKSPDPEAVEALQASIDTLAKTRADVTAARVVTAKMVEHRKQNNFGARLTEAYRIKEA